MNWITVSWSMLAGACLSMALVELRVGLAQPRRIASLLLSFSALIVAINAGLELALMHAESAGAADVLVRWIDLAVFLITTTLTAFVWVFFGTGNRWLALASPTLFAAALVFDYVPGTSLTYSEVTGIRTEQTIGGATFNVVEGVPNPWNVMPYLAVLIMLVFVVDASVRLWRRGGRERAAVVGGSISVFLLAGGIHAALIDSGILRSPYLISWAYLAILLAMGYEVSAEVLEGARLSRQLQESERRAELASAAANVGLWTWDIPRDQVWATPRARELLGASKTESLNWARFLATIHNDDRDFVRSAIEGSLVLGDDFDAEFRVSDVDGETRWVAGSGRVYQDAPGEPTLFRGTVIDISGRRQADLEMQRLRSQLAHNSRVSMMGQLASAIAHEISQPLGAILRNAEAAEMFLQQNPPDLEELRAILVDIRNDDQRAADVIERLRGLLKRRELDRRALVVENLLSNVAALIAAEAASRHIRLEFATAAEMPKVIGDVVQVQQVVLNLVLNAMDAVDDVLGERRRVEVRTQRSGARMVEISVSDNGAGIPPKSLELVFEPFFTTKESGMGVGLPISRTIIESLGGRIWAENNAQGGATFRFTLPEAEEAAAL